MKTKTILGIILATALFSSCCRKESQNNNGLTAGTEQKGFEQVTQRISYAVTIKNFNDSLGYSDNIVNPAKQKFTDAILNNVLNGNIKAFTPQHEPLKIEDLKAALTVEKEFVKEDENGNQISIKKVFDMSKMIDKIGFIEEWSINPQTLQVNKKVIGLSPMIPVFLSDGTVAGFLELFWIYFDEKYPAALKTTNPA